MALVQSNTTDGVTLTGLANASSAPFLLLGGLYGVTVSGTIVSLSVNRLGPDGSTYVPAMAVFTATGYATAYLPAGAYEAVAGATTTANVAVQRIHLT